MNSPSELNVPAPSYYPYFDTLSQNAICVKTPEGRFYYSYDTFVAFYTKKTGTVCRQNEWSQTTGKHLNLIKPDHSKRVSEEEFVKIYNRTFKRKKS